MFWTRCDKIINEGGIVDSKKCPCPSYIYVTICNEENGNDNCGSCIPEEAAAQASLAVLHESESGDCIVTGSGKYKLDRKYPNGENKTFRYVAIEKDGGVRKYPTHAKGAAEWDKHPRSYWGEKVIAACNCCCLLNAEYLAEFNIKTYSFQQMWAAVSEPFIVSEDESTNYFNSTGAGAEVEFNAGTKTAKAAQYHERSEYKLANGGGLDDPDWDWQCEVDQTDGDITLLMTFSEDCKKLLLTGLNIRRESVYENRCNVSSFTSDWIASTLNDGDSYPEIPISDGYAEGSFTLNSSKTIYNGNDYYTNTLEGQITLRRKNNPKPASDYRTAYDQLDERLTRN